MSGRSGTHELPAGGSDTPGDRFGHLVERRDDADFPFYNDVPAALSVKQWIILWASVIVGFAALVLIPQPNNFVGLNSPDPVRDDSAGCAGHGDKRSLACTVS
ncbi:MAG: hypothetical protein U5O16_31450 [Rhodococcus sp. (in: high G+C Gram-positive bacteria)]|uniref:hypothetical protein n=1 Tax=Rhodococcus sp. TaxID=1831 RepID=UPI002AD9E44C|nr:hypothetical protein [Rhodococcus sp. (in: high G+C Gram-positive bacteria)]